MKKLSALLALIAILSLTMALMASANTPNLSAYADISTMEPTKDVTPEMLDAYKVENVQIAPFPNTADGNILASTVNGQDSYVIYKFTATEGNVFKGMTLKSYASVYDWGQPPVGNKFGVYVKETDDFNFETDTPVDGASGMVQKKNHTWKLDKEVEGKSEVYVCIYFVNNSEFIDWVRFYSFDITSTEKSLTPETEPETKPVTTEKPVVTEPDVTTEAPVVDTTVTTDVQTNEGSGDAEPAPVNPIAIILIVAAALIAIVVIVAIIKIMKK
ncbi:MAG: hypothetical protein E7618_01815 [Ruminococcaceae bacterium]|nr:hypothetical protein [Oscillospiraceae bacterium]